MTRQNVIEPDRMADKPKCQTLTLIMVIGVNKRKGAQSE